MAMRHTEVLKLVKSNRLLYRPLGIDSVISADGLDAYVNGMDFVLTPEGNLEWKGKEDVLGKEVVVVYER